ncbi:hypothetical protein A2U01_0082478, partial [Trifolium medium]|nr:hypothetical protein [Trifolium medium]
MKSSGAIKYSPTRLRNIKGQGTAMPSPRYNARIKYATRLARYHAK